MTNRFVIFACVLALLSSTSAHANRDTIVIVGSSTVFPFSKVVAERFGRKTHFRAPKVEPTGTGGGFKEFCRGIGIGTPDIVNASRRIKPSELSLCKGNAVGPIVEVLFGYDGIVLAQSNKATPLALSLKDIFLALAARVPDPASPGKLITNPYITWYDIDPRFPKTNIRVFGPPPTSGTRDAFVELAMEGGCQQYSWIKELKNSNNTTYKAICHSLRNDGGYIDAGENDNLIVRKLNENKDALGLFGFSFLDQNADKVRGLNVGGEAPTFESIASGRYVVSRPLYFYVKKTHAQLIAGIPEFLNEFVSDTASGNEGYLTEKGLIPLNSVERNKVKQRILHLEPLETL